MSCLIDNKFEPGKGTEFNSINPASQGSIWQGRTADAEQVSRAITSARKAFDSWSLLSLKERLKYLEAYIALLDAKQEDLATLIMEETGKNANDARMETKIMLGKYQVSLDAYVERTGVREKEIKGSFSITKHKPHGVCAVFGPYNFPGHIPNGHILPALLAGNTIVFKPSNYVPKFSEEWMKLFVEAGFPEGVVNMVQGEVATGEYLSQDDDINALFFTGSSRVGEILHRSFAGKLDKLLALELGGNNALVIDDECDLDEAVEIAIKSAFVSNGQRCTCARRIILVEKIAESFIDKFIEKTKAIEIDKPEAGKFMSCLISKEQADLVLAKQEEYKNNGAEILLEAQKHSLGPAFISPAILKINEQDKDEEVFGPFVKLYIAKDLDQAIEFANQTNYGLVSAIVTKNETHYDKFYSKLKTGLINWNTATTGAMGIAPFGGTGLSGNHRPSAYYAADYCAYPVASVQGPRL